MDMIRIDDIRGLIGSHDGPCVSIYMPTHSGGRKEVEQDPIRFKNQVQKAERALVANGVRTAVARELIGRVQPLLEDWNFWNHQSEGLALFLSRDNIRHYRLPAQFDEVTMVGERFYIKPLVPLLTNDGKFYILSLSKDHVRLLQGTRDSVSEVKLDSVPSGMEDALKFEDIEAEKKFYTGSPQRGPGANSDVAFFSAGSNELDHKNALLRYFQKVDRGLWNVLREERAPLVLAGVEYVFPLFREASRYPNIVEGIPGNPDNESPAELHRKAWEIVRPRFESAQMFARQKFENLKGTGSGQVSDALAEILPAAHAGRIDTLFVPRQEHRYGKYRSGDAEVNVHDRPANGDEELYDLATAHTLVNSGTVFAVKAIAMPGGRDVAAIFRY